MNDLSAQMQTEERRGADTVITRTKENGQFELEGQFKYFDLIIKKYSHILHYL